MKVRVATIALIDGVAYNPNQHIGIIHIDSLWLCSCVRRAWVPHVFFARPKFNASGDVVKVCVPPLYVVIEGGQMGVDESKCSR